MKIPTEEELVVLHMVAGQSFGLIPGKAVFNFLNYIFNV
jgi:hypothetical protein